MRYAFGRIVLTPENALMGDRPQDQAMPNRSYYRNSLLAWRSQLLKQRRQLMARFATMERMNHPDKRDQGYLLEINEEALMSVDRALRPLGVASVKENAGG